jgi:hypothetical protein
MPLLVLASAAVWLWHQTEPEIVRVHRCETWVRAAERRTIERERFRCEEENYQAYQRGWANAAMGTCVPAPDER